MKESWKILKELKTIKSTFSPSLVLGSLLTAVPGKRKRLPIWSQCPNSSFSGGTFEKKQPKRQVWLSAQDVFDFKGNLF